MVTFLKFGDYIMLHCIENSPLTAYDTESMDPKTMQGGFHGFLAGLGFTDEGLYVQLEKHDNLRMIHQPSEIIDKIPILRSSREFIFQITPRLNYESHEDLEKNLRYYKELRHNNLFLQKDPSKYLNLKKY